MMGFCIFFLNYSVAKEVEARILTHEEAPSIKVTSNPYQLKRASLLL